MKKKATIPLPLAPNFPDELMREILLRLPVRCLLRSKCVCKSWLFLISNPQFAKSHFDLAAAPTHRLLLKFSDDSEANSVDTEASLDDDSTEVVFKIPNPSPIPKHETTTFLFFRNNGWKVNVVGSCRGFLLLTSASSDFIYFIIWNPSTGMQKRFTKVWSKLPYLCGIGYNSSIDDYMVVMVIFPYLLGRTGTEVHCFSLRTNSWSCTVSTVPYKHIGGEYGHGSLLNGALHWLVLSSDDHFKIIAFDVTEKSLSDITLPHELVVSCFFYHLRVMGECLCICVANDRTSLAEVWMMKEYKVQSSWTKIFVFSPYFRPLCHFLPICFTKNGDILGHDCLKTLVRRNDKGKLLKQRTHGVHLFDDQYDLLHYGMYRESLLSLPET